MLSMYFLYGVGFKVCSLLVVRLQIDVITTGVVTDKYSLTDEFELLLSDGLPESTEFVSLQQTGHSKYLQIMDLVIDKGLYKVCTFSKMFYFKFNITMKQLEADRNLTMIKIAFVSRKIYILGKTVNFSTTQKTKAHEKLKIQAVQLLYANIL